MIDHVGELMEAGLDSLKIEGRAKSAYYAALVTGAYRHAIDAAAAGKPLEAVWRDEVEKVSHRHYSTGFYYGDAGQYYENSRYIREWQINGIVQSCDQEGNAIISLRNKFKAGDEMEIVGPDLAPVAFTAPMMEELTGAPLEEPKKPQMLFKMKLPVQAPPLSVLRHQAERL
jgi:putative protease